LGKGGEPIAHQTEPAFSIGKAIVVREGSDVSLISTSGILSEVVAAAEQLAPQIQARVLSMPTVKPLDEDALHQAVAETRVIVTVEEHSAVGGLGSAVAEVLAGQRNRQCPLLTLNLGDKPPHAVGSQTYLRRKLGIDSSGIARAVRERLRHYAQSAV
jgi:transketolase